VTNASAGLSFQVATKKSSADDAREWSIENAREAVERVFSARIAQNELDEMQNGWSEQSGKAKSLKEIAIRERIDNS